EVGKLADVTGPVTIAHRGDVEGLNAALSGLQDHIAQVVERVNRHETELLRSEQLAQVGQLAAGLAHELRNPLMPMKVLVQAALERGDEGGLRGRALEVIDQEITRLERSIQTFLDYARPPAVEKVPADLREVVLQTLDLVGARAAQRDVAIRANLPDAPVVSRIDRVQMRQLLLNLILNALDELRRGGNVEVTLTPHALPGGGADGDATPEDAPDGVGPPWFAIRVADDGPGIPPESLDRVFAPFVTTKETGTGLGLSICRRIAAAHQGTLTAANRPAGGAEFTLAIPYDT
ncbi:MAG: histidine kinase, partial [Thermoleophilia bacterium]|nr:histidine kinase [Thermoleophilia bacterium]